MRFSLVVACCALLVPGSSAADDRPDLVTIAVSNPPAVAAPGSGFVVTDTVLNRDGHTARASVTRYLLSLDRTKGSSDVPLIGARAVPPLAERATSTGSVTVTIPGSVPLGRYFLLACADALDTVGEDRETNNCAASVGAVTLVRPTVSIAPSALNFGSVRQVPAVSTPPQTITLTQSLPGTMSWSATASQPWITVTPASGTGPASIRVAINGAVSGAPVGSSSAAITISTSGANNPTAIINLNVMPQGTNREAFGSIDTPSQGQTGVVGSIAVTGWALDDIGVSRVRIVRDAVAGEPAGSQPFIGFATFVGGARSDVSGLFPAMPLKDQAGWGYLMLTNFLPNRGNGTFTIHAIADDVEGHSTLLASRTITCDNAHSTTPFGAIDTPDQGAAVKGVIPVFGWVLSPGAARSDPPSGGSVTMFVDGIAQGSPFGWVARPDLTALFPESQYAGIGSALGVFILDTGRFANGLHTMSWGVRDNLGHVAGIGSRFFLIANDSSATILEAALAVPESAAPSTAWSLSGRSGFDPREPFRLYDANADGLVTVRAAQLDPIELRTSANAASLRTPEGPAPLPIGARLADDGTFLWQPGPGFIGAYEFDFSTAQGVHTVRIVVGTRGPRPAGARITIDRPAPGSVVTDAFDIAGSAVDLDAAAGSGIDTIHVWALPVGGAAPVFLGVASLGASTPGAAALFGDQFDSSGYAARAARLPPGVYDIAVFAWSHRLGGFLPARTVRVIVR